MILRDTDLDALTSLADEACRAARDAGHLIATSRPTRIESKPGDSAASRIVTEIDRRAEKRILEILAPTTARFDLAVLSEEQPDDRARLVKSHFWSIDPLDGTLPFVEGSPGYAVSIALVSRAGAPVIGVVFDPVADVLFRAIACDGFTREPPLSPAPAAGKRLSVFADRSVERDRDSVVSALDAIASELGLSGVDLHIGAGAVMNACYTLEAAPACYIKVPKPEPGGGSLWDFAATACLFGEAGAVATDIRGAPLDLNRADATTMNHRGVLYATDSTLAAKLRARFSPKSSTSA